jgi:hypothetical protein
MGADEAVVRVTRPEHLAPGRTVGTYAQHGRLLISTHGAAVPTGSAVELATYSGEWKPKYSVAIDAFFESGHLLCKSAAHDAQSLVAQPAGYVYLATAAHMS